MGDLYARAIRWAFARFYREFAWTYDAVAAVVSGGHWREWALASLPYLRGSVLELGCGPGHLMRALGQRPQRPFAVGLDVSPQMLARARRRLARAGLPVALARADARTLPFASAVFDSVVATFPSEYIIDPATLAEARRVLRPGGRLIVIPAAQFDASGPYQRLVDLAYRLTLQRSPLSAAPTRTSPFGQALEQAGFAVEERIDPAPGGQVHVVIADRRS